MNNKFLPLLTVMAILSASYPVHANNPVMGATINWNVPTAWAKDKAVLSYSSQITNETKEETEPVQEKTEQEFNPEVWLETSDDTLTNYATSSTDLPMYDTWTNVSAEYDDVLAPTLDKDAKTYMKFQKFGYNSNNYQSHLSRGSYAYTGDYQIRMVDGRMLIALGTGFVSTIGTYVDVQLENGKVLACILGDIKSDAHTDPTRMYQKWDKSVLEFIVDSPGVDGSDYSYFKRAVPEASNGNFTGIEIFNSKVKTVRVYNKVFDIDMSDMSNDNPDMR